MNQTTVHFGGYTITRYEHGDDLSVGRVEYTIDGHEACRAEVQALIAQIQAETA